MTEMEWNADEFDLDECFSKLLLDSDSEDLSDVNDDIQDALVFRDERESDSESDRSAISNTVSEESWISDCEPSDRFKFTEQTGPTTEVFLCEEPIDFYELFLNKEILDLIVEETNRQGNRKYDDFENTCVEEIRQLIGLCLQMGVVKLPSLRDYWSTRFALGSNAIAGKVMSRKRFEKLMNSLHFADNHNSDGDKLYKIKKLLQLFNDSCEKSYHPGKTIAIDESMVPFRGRIGFRQYIPSKKHKYGIKLFKLCCKGGYTWRTKIYAGKEPFHDGPVADSVVLELMKGLLDKGRQLCTDNWYSSVGLAKKLLQRSTNLIGTLRKNRKGTPTEVKGRKLKRGEIYFRQNRSGILVLKWRDKRDLLMISTTHDASFGQNEKSQVVEDYNNVMGYVDQSDQIAAYSPFVRKTTKWYIRIFFHIITQTAVVNAWVLYNLLNNKTKLNEFKMILIESLLQEKTPVKNETKRLLEEVDGPRNVFRKRCAGCYKKNFDLHGRLYASNRTRKVVTRCSSCYTYYCLNCFQLSHKKCVPH